MSSAVPCGVCRALSIPDTKTGVVEPCAVVVGDARDFVWAQHPLAALALSSLEGW